ncbi:MAG: glycoside hydrolase family 97 protein [Candidatus Aminicenantales bacterium]
MMKNCARGLLVIFLFSTFIHGGELAEVTSPDRRISLQVSVESFSSPFPQGDYLAYSIHFRGQTIISPSPLQLLLKGAPSIGAEVEVIDRIEKRINERTEIHHGKTSFLHNYASEICLRLREKEEPHREFLFIARAYNDAVAFRLHFPHQPGLEHVNIEAENTYIRSQPGTAYALILDSFNTSYENNYTIAPLEELSPEKLIGLPLLIKTQPGPWLAIAEADLEDYPGMYLSLLQSEETALVSRLSPLPGGNGLCARIKMPHDLPWRVFMIADHPGSMIESDTIMNLSDPSRIENPCWIKPGKAAWPWWSGRTVRGRKFQGGMNTSTMKYYLDFAAQAGFEYLLIDAGWYGDHRSAKEDITTWIPALDLPQVLGYAEMKGVGIVLWLNWECLKDQMERAFPLYQEWGVKGIKVDYMNRDDQEMVNFYREICERAARCHLVVDFHGAFKPTGLRRVYPNLLTREGVLGLEYSKWSEKCSPDHEVVIPYTRMLVGPMDFTPGVFNVSSRETFKPHSIPPLAQGTRAHQLAMYVVYESPLQMVADHPDSILGQTGFDFLKAVPTVWDETLFVGGVVGDYIILARRKGEEWYVGGMTGWSEKNVSLPLTFLKPGKYMASIYSDASGAESDPTLIHFRRMEVNRRELLDIHMAPGGGFAIRITPTWD